MRKITLKYIKKPDGVNTTYGFISLFLWPFWFFCDRSKVHFCDGYGWVKSFGGRLHEGVDIDGDGLDLWNDPLNEKSIFSPCQGVITFAGYCGGYGNMIEIQCNGLNNFYKLYFRFGHLSKLIVKNGQKINKSQVIGFVGSTGHSTSPHVHAEAWVKNIFGKKRTVDAGKLWYAIFRGGE